MVGKTKSLKFGSWPTKNYGNEGVVTENLEESEPSAVCTQFIHKTS